MHTHQEVTAAFTEVMDTCSVGTKDNTVDFFLCYFWKPNLCQKMHLVFYRNRIPEY